MYDFIINPNAGGGKGLQYVDLVTTEIKARSIPARIHLTTGPGHAIELASRIETDSTHVIAVGGDGTVNEVINGIIEKPVNFGIIPCGTGNDFMKMVKISPNVPTAIDQILKNKTISIDVGHVKSNTATRFFVNSLGIGFDAVVADKANQLKQFGVFAYLYAVISTLLTYKEPLMEWVSEQQNVNQSLFLMTFGNGTNAGGLFKLTPDALLDDGWFQTVLLSNVKIHRVFKVLPKVFSGNHLSEPEVSFFNSKSGSLKISLPSTIHTDGEIIDRQATDIEIRLLEHKKQVLVG